MPDYAPLKQIIKGEVYSDPETLEAYSKDASLFKVVPKAVAAPKDAEDVKALVKFVSSRKDLDPELSLTPRSGGSDMTGGPLGSSIVLDFAKHFNKIIEIGSDYAIVEPGVFYRDFEKATLARGLLLPCFPASRELCTLGGMVANNSSGEKTLAYGSTKEFVRELKVVLADGEEYVIKPLNKTELDGKLMLKNFEGEFYRKIFKLVDDNFSEIKSAKPRVSKNSSGYLLWDVWDKTTFDLTRLFTGSQGTLGFITQIKFKLIKPRPFSKLVVVFLKDIKPLALIVNEVLKFKPETFESYDDHTLRLAIRFFPEFLKRLKLGLFGLGLKFIPEILAVLRGGLPKLVLTAEFTGETPQEAGQKALEARNSLLQFNVYTHITQDAVEADKYRMIRRESFNLLRQKVKNKQTAPFIDDIIVPPERLPEFLPELEATLNKYQGFTYTIAGHVGNGNFHIIPLVDLKEEKIHRAILDMEKEVNTLVFKYGGSMSGEHNDGLVRGPYLLQMFGPKVYGFFVETKNIFDPLNIFNPGKKSGATLDFASRHIKYG